MELGTGAIGSLLPKLIELLKDEYALHKGVRKKIKHLSRELESIHAVLCNIGEALYQKTTELVGIEKQSEKLMKMLSLVDDDVHAASEEEMKIVSIVGFGGLGKTTLSRAVYEKYKPAFDCGAFVPVGRDPDMKKVLRDVLIDFDYMNPNVMILDERQLINKLRKLIQNKRITDGEDRFLDSLSTEACDKILKKCGGVPLAIITIASLLASKSREDWPKVYNSIGFEYGIEKNLLIWKWIGEGFIQNEQEATATELFELGEGYFNELINRSMIQTMELEDNGYVYGCRVHDMVLDLIRSFSSEGKFATILDNNGQQKLMGTNARRFAVHGRSVGVHNHPQLVNMGLEKVRSFSATQCGDINVVTSCFRVLRVLTIEDCSVGEACGKQHRLQHIGNLRHLRYLGILNTQIDELPKEVGDLKFLQTLNFSVLVVQEQDMETLGRLPELSYLKLNSDYTRLVSIRKTNDGVLHRYFFKKLRFFLTPFSSVEFDLHGCESDTATPSIVMPRLESLVFSVHVRLLKDVDMQPGLDDLLLGFERVASASLQQVTAIIQCEDATAAEVEEAKAALGHAGGLHPNRPTLITEMENKRKML
ncbi:unnamed protein product [Urochloa decumbens]|uniref:NB-ARC domain-containing protein n=1 Tax=Urochloa decumbens TaxID=240449 RepID=A0ABC9ANT7_9POAL